MLYEYCHSLSRKQLLVSFMQSSAQYHLVWFLVVSNHQHTFTFLFIFLCSVGSQACGQNEAVIADNAWWVQCKIHTNNLLLLDCDLYSIIIIHLDLVSTALNGSSALSSFLSNARWLLHLHALIGIRISISHTAMGIRHAVETLKIEPLIRVMATKHAAIQLAPGAIVLIDLNFIGVGVFLLWMG